MSWLDADVVAAVRHHMADDHAADTLLIVQAHEPEAVAAAVETLDLETITLTATMRDGSARSVTLDWPEPLTERADIRHQVVALYLQAGGAPH